ncbi:MAG: PKD domain-containing protein [Candidatus Cloacimonadota bacterium]|nr:PKD domain-containing protein [Candidatus Cloacimonadota bacterium]
MKNTRSTLIIFILLYSFAFLSATIINIPADYSQIQQGIDVSAEGDTILVQPGTYYENINYNGHNIVVASMFLTTQDSSYIEQTIIDGSQNGRVVTFEDNENSTTVLTGFTIRNGYASGSTYPDNRGGGISIDSSSPTLNNLIVTNNQAVNAGGISFWNNANAMLYRITVVNNFSYNNSGGIHFSNSNPILTNVIIKNNFASSNSGGIGFSSCSPTLINTLIADNTAMEKGGAIYLSSGACPVLENVTICNNNSSWSAIHCDTNSCPNLFNCILWNNSPSEILLDYGGTISINYSDIKNGWEGLGNISSNPLFVNPYIGNYHLQEASPCIDAGDPASPLDPDGTIADMGAYYFHQLNADFSGNPLSGATPLEVQFTDLSLGNILVREWDFNNDGIIDSYLQNPSYTFIELGVYTITLTVSDGVEEDTEIKTNYITVTDSLHADFEGSPINGEFPLEVQFTNLSMGDIIGYMWDFDNDGSIDSNQQNPLFIYEQIGSYDVSLTITDGFDEDTEVKFNYITVVDTTSLSNNTYLLHTILHQNYPNPFNPTTTISFELNTEVTGNSELVIYNLKGQKVKSFPINQFTNSPVHQVIWNGTDESGKPVTTGVYLYKLQAGDKTYTKKMLLLK